MMWHEIWNTNLYANMVTIKDSGPMIPSLNISECNQLFCERWCYVEVKGRGRTAGSIIFLLLQILKWLRWEGSKLQ